MVDRRYSVVPLGTLVTSILCGYLLDGVLPIIEIVPTWLKPLGWAMIALGVLLIGYCATSLLAKQTTLDPGGKPSSLLKTGPYAFSRNPLYVGDLLIATGAAIVLASLSAFVAPVLFFLVVDTFVIPHEERNLQAVFGDAYEEYRRSVRRWI